MKVHTSKLPDARSGIKNDAIVVDGREDQEEEEVGPYGFRGSCDGGRKKEDAGFTPLETHRTRVGTGEVEEGGVANARMPRGEA